MKTYGIIIIMTALLAGLTLSLSAAEEKPGSQQSQKKEIRLTDLEPTDAEYGSISTGTDGKKEPSPSQISFGTWSASGFWPENRKIVKDLAKGASISEGKKYDSMNMRDIFAVGGEFTTGGGLLTRVPNSYHWIEYKIPDGAKSFTASVMITDDVAGYTRSYPGNKNQQFDLEVLIDGTVELKNLPSVCHWKQDQDPSSTPCQSGFQRMRKKSGFISNPAVGVTEITISNS